MQACRWTMCNVRPASLHGLAATLLREQHALRDDAATKERQGAVSAGLA
ncbi:unnamed protein product (plasmid) [Mycetohabitans rhizoxinica HKI 454]|uniref:Uncharacterized protein n=1 Tax=Mycetohabitans rhizoxinica (strain DSM 19002 / CIP 109453 / HKI 454) TaxID=882378 RepID=E5AUQ0_MYCRK|nr:unnamed protein product [Mycetohabitans rhizoxinica HKI 454]